MALRNLNELKVFVQVVESGSVSAAARALQLPQATVSRRLAALEERLETKLIFRNTRSMQISEAGETLLQSARTILNEAAAVEIALAHETEGLSGVVKIAVGTFLSRELLVALGPLLEKHPALHARIIVRDQFVNPIAEGVDVSIIAGPLSDSALVARKLLDVNFVMAASESYLARHAAPKTVEELGEHQAVVASSHQPYAILSDDEGNQHAFHARSRLQVQDGRAMLDAVSLGLGIGLVSVRALHRRPELKRVLPGYKMGPRALLAVYPAAMKRSARLNTVVEHLVSTLEPVMG